MTPYRFPEANITLAEDQPEYQPLPAVVSADGSEIITCWRPTFWEALKLLWTRRVWLHTLVYGRPIQPVIVTVHKLFTMLPEAPAVEVDTRADTRTDAPHPDVDGPVSDFLPACMVPPPGWWCSRPAGHDGPCCARQNGSPDA